MRNFWQTVDTVALQQRRNEQTTSANVGAYPVPLGAPMRREFPEPVAVSDPLQQLAGADPEYARALRAMGWLR